MAGIEELLVSIVSKFDDAGFKKLDHSTASASKATNILSNNLRNLFVGVIGTIGVSEIVQATVKMDSLRTSMNALAGSDIGGAEQIEFLRKETDRLGQSFLTTANAYKNLFSAGKGAGMSDKDIQSIFSGVLEAGTVLGSSEQQLQGALTALEQMISKGKVSTQELRLQLGNALPGAMQIAARAMKVTNKEFQKMLESGLDSQKFVMAFANQLHAEFSGKATGASHTLRAELARLQNSIFDLETSLLDGDAGKEFANVIRQITSLLQSDQVKQSLNAVAQILTVILQHSKEIALIVGVIFGNKMLTGLAKGLVGAGAGIAKGLKMAMNFKSLTAGMAFLPRIWQIVRLAIWALNPLTKITLIISLITAIIAGVVWLKKYFAKQDEKKRPNWQKLDESKYGKDRYIDTNPESPTFGKQGRGYTQEQLNRIKSLDLSDNFLNSLLTTEGKPYSEYINNVKKYRMLSENPEPILNDWFKKATPTLKKQNSLYSTNSISINKIEITTKSDDTDGIVNGIRSEFTKILDNFGKGSGYLSTPRIEF